MSRATVRVGSADFWVSGAIPLRCRELVTSNAALQAGANECRVI
jgi:hypothetical protein